MAAFIITAATASSYLQQFYCQDNSFRPHAPAPVLWKHVTRHTSHVTCHMSYVTRHTSHVTHQHITRHPFYAPPKLVVVYMREEYILNTRVTTDCYLC